MRIVNSDPPIKADIKNPNKATLGDCHFTQNKALEKFEYAKLVGARRHPGAEPISNRGFSGEKVEWKYCLVNLAPEGQPRNQHPARMAR
jgi:hypothetical protein